MPPALSDEESSDVGEFTTPPRTSRTKSTSAVAAPEQIPDDVKSDDAPGGDEDDEDDEDLDEDVESAQEILDQYLEKFGGREQLFEQTETAAKTKKRRRATNGTSSATSTTTKRSRRTEAHPADSTPPTTAKKWSPPAGSWEDEIETIDACEDEGSGKLIVYLIWKNGHKTKHDVQIIYKKCPQRMLRFYERHVKIIREENKALADGAEN
ncbi:Putative chromatin-associated swi6 [Fusarium acuminatum]|uniref:Chromatin-associated swi6 n=1 Tax=Fusarium acuminatum TaxID=5515 RepID=A0ABZ2X7Y7_9HYPO